MRENDAPLADRLRPKKLADFIGQQHLVGQGGILRKLLQADQLVSLILWGPPGSGKTSLSQIIAQATKSHFVSLSAVTSSLDEVRRVIKEAEVRQATYQQRTILFIDEIHRFSKLQQDVFLPHVEKGTIILIGATTENPSFEVIGPLLSRCKVLVLKRLSESELDTICERGLKELKIKIKDDARAFLTESANGDARVVLNTLEVAKTLAGNRLITLVTIEKALQSKLLYDRLGEEHYNTISAFIKSMRASNVDAALYYLARMVEAGEDPLFIARRMVIFASEDIGMAQPTALVVANEVFRACETIGYPECAINLAHGVVYLAKAPKNRSAYNGLRAVQEDVRKYGNLPIPLNLRNPVTKLMKKIGYGSGYRPYTTQSLLPERIKNRHYYFPDEHQVKK